MYSDTWRKDASLRKVSALAVDRQINVEYWVDREMELVGVCVNFEFADDVHYELEANNWFRFLTEVLHVLPHADYEKALRAFLDTELPQVAFGEALDAREIVYKKLAFYDVEDMG